MLDAATKKVILTAQKNELTEYHIYRRFARNTKDAHNSQALENIAAEELEHYHFWKSQSGEEVRPSKFKLWRYSFIAHIFGLTFGIKLMEKGEKNAQGVYASVARVIPQAAEIAAHEQAHEQELIGVIDEERLRYIGSMVLGLNDAIVELTGALAGFTFALQNRELIALTGLITGIAGALSMAASEYLSTKTEETTKSPLKASLYTGSVYIVAVILLVSPYLLLGNFYACLGVTVAVALLLIYLFTYYVSVARDTPFGSRFAEMAAISMGIAVISFGFGLLMRLFFNVEV